MSLKIIAISDTHRLHGRIKLPPGDVLIHAGDALSHGTADEWIDFTRWWNDLQYGFKIYVGGNHDWILEREPEWAIDQLKNTHYLQDSGVTIEGKLFYGSPWQRPFCNWAFNREDNFRHGKFDKIPFNTYVLITHTPPEGYCDKLGHDRIGDTHLAARTEITAPPIHICGHIHYGYGIELRDFKVVGSAGIVVNAAICNEGYKPVNAPITIRI